MSLPTFRASFTSEMLQLFADPSQLLEVVTKERRPVAVSLPQAAVSNVADFQKTLQSLSIDARVFLAHKATSSPAILSALSSLSSIDVASEAELNEALSAGYPAQKVLATGPKSHHFLKRLSELPGVTIAIDSFSELQRLALMTNGQQPVDILLRLSRSITNQPGITKKSRFGLDETHLEAALRFLVDHTHVTLKGIHFHLDSQSIDERRFAVKTAIDTLLAMQQKGFYRATILDIGGGYGTTYGVNKVDTDKFEAAIRAMVLGRRPHFTWQAHSFGIYSNGNLTSGGLSAVDIPAEVTGVQRLASILDSKDAGMTLAELLNENLIELWIEPGAAICASAGLFAAEVIEVNDRDGETMLLVDAHRNQVCFEGIEHVADPILVSRKQSSKNRPCEAYITGHLCMESDFLTYRKIHFSNTPQPGDVLVWLHTGAYSSHFSASQAIGHPLPARYTLMAEGLVKDS